MPKKVSFVACNFMHFNKYPRNTATTRQGEIKKTLNSYKETETMPVLDHTENLKPLKKRPRRKIYTLITTKAKKTRGRNKQYWGNYHKIYNAIAA